LAAGASVKHEIRIVSPIYAITLKHKK